MIQLHSESDTKRVAEALSRLLKPTDCLTLTGNLGAGKTTFMRFLIRTLSSESENVTSPSFTIIQEYEVQLSGKKSPIKLYHLDGYRLNDTSEIPELGLEEMLESGIVCIEWPEIFASYLPESRLEITIEMLENQQRNMRLSGRGHHATITSQLSKELSHSG